MIIKEGVRPSGNDYVFDFTNDQIEDLINTSISKELNFRKFSDNSYYFGYRFNDNVSKEDRTKFIEWLKSQTKLTPDLESFIVRPIKALKKELNFNDFDLFLYPLSERSKLTNLIIKSISNITGRDVDSFSIEAIKNIPSSVHFDYYAFKRDYGLTDSSQKFKDVYNYVENVLLPKINDLTYFSIAKNVKVKYRDYIQDYLKIRPESEKLIEAINEGNILIVDDISTSGATLRELIRMVSTINNKCNIYIFTLIGKEE